MKTGKNPNTMDLVSIAYEYKKKSLEMVKWKQIWLTYENGYRTMRAKIAKKIRLENPEFSEARLESESLGSEEYQEYLKNWDTATGEYLRAQIETDAWKMYYEARRTMEASRRVEIMHDVSST